MQGTECYFHCFCFGILDAGAHRCLSGWWPLQAPKDGIVLWMPKPSIAGMAFCTKGYTWKYGIFKLSSHLRTAAFIFLLLMHASQWQVKDGESFLNLWFFFFSSWLFLAIVEALVQIYIQCICQKNWIFCVWRRKWNIFISCMRTLALLKSVQASEDLCPGQSLKKLP